MTFESAQTNFQGQQGWNDLAPDALNIANVAKNNKGKVRPKRVVTPITPLPSQDLTSSTGGSSVSLPSLTASAPPKAFSAPPKVFSTTSLQSSPTAPPKASPAAPPKASSAATLITPSPSTTPTDDCDVSVGELKNVLLALSKRPSNLKQPEIDATLQKLEAQYAQLSRQQRVFLKEALAFEPAEKTKARKMLVDYSLIHSNVSQWTVPVRRLIDQQQ